MLCIDIKLHKFSIICAACAAVKVVECSLIFLSKTGERIKVSTI